MAKSGLTPMMQQFFDLKAKHPDALMLFRCGDFYETYCEDAEIAAKILGITLTRRSSVAGTSASGTAMAGFPHHALDTYLPKLIRAGKRVAICDQLEDPKLTKKLVKRGITELVTPGVAIGDNVLQPQENNFLSAIHFGKAACGVAFLDISTGEFLVSEGTYDYVAKLLSDFSPKEVLYEKGRRADFLRNLSTVNSQLSKYCVYELDDWAFNEAVAKERLLKHFSVKNLKGFGVEHLKNGITAAGAVMQYLDITQHTQTSHITAISRIEEEKYVRLDSFTSRNLELVRPMSSDGVSLLDIINKTVTPMGGRTMHRWLLFPLKNVNHINERLDVVDYFFRHPDFRSVINENFALVGDIERIISKVAVGRVTPREVLQLRNALRALEPVKSACEATEDERLQAVGKQLNCCLSLCERIEKELNPDAPAQIAKGDVIAIGYNEELDELRQISHGGKDYLLQIQQREIERTGISSLKIGFNNVFGYYIEVRNTYKEQVPEDWIRKQTLAQAERYITQELKEYEDQILGAEDRIAAMEARLFGELVADMNQFIPAIQRDAVVVARIDCLHAFAMVAEENHYIRPVMDESTIIDIHLGRHPVIERQLPPGESYVPNDVLLDNNSQQIMIITGPNMAGKSALLRQTALITIMAQMGCFVPAESARIGVVDKVFTRVGASDNISLGESTFMVEMSEAANILNNVTERSLVLFDELGRGTSTYDGISIAWAIVEFLHERPRAKARTLFATHYHELNEMEKTYQRIRNYNVSVKEIDGKVLFVRKLEKGGSEHSFGIHVARLAGMPQSIVKRADEILHTLEESGAKEGRISKPTATIANNREGMQMSFFQLDDPILSQIRDEILELDIDNLTPMEALNKLNDIKKIVKGKR